LHWPQLLPHLQLQNILLRWKKSFSNTDIKEATPKQHQKQNQTVNVKVAEKKGKRMTYTIAVVDEGLLDLTRFKTPNAWNSFYTREALGVRTWDIYDDVIGAYVPMKEMGGGSGLKYAASSIIYLSKKKEKDGTDVIGNIIKCKTQKSRLSKENQDVEVRLYYDERGLDKYYGLLELGELGGMWKNVAGRYEIDGKKITINGIAKGSGMIAPDMATMLAFVFTDANIDAKTLQTMLNDANGQQTQ
jgi:hypothetical protein